MIIFTKITHALKKEKDIYYIPNIINNKSCKMENENSEKINEIDNLIES